MNIFLPLILGTAAVIFLNLFIKELIKKLKSNHHESYQALVIKSSNLLEVYDNVSKTRLLAFILKRKHRKLNDINVSYYSDGALFLIAAFFGVIISALEVFFRG